MKIRTRTRFLNLRNLPLIYYFAEAANRFWRTNQNFLQKKSIQRLQYSVFFIVLMCVVVEASLKSMKTQSLYKRMHGVSYVWPFIGPPTRGVLYY